MILLNHAGQFGQTALCGTSGLSSIKFNVWLTAHSRILKKLIVAELVMKFPTFYGI